MDCRRGRISMAPFQHACMIVPQPSIAFADEGASSPRVMMRAFRSASRMTQAQKKAALADGLFHLWGDDSASGSPGRAERLCGLGGKAAGGLGDVLPLRGGRLVDL